MGLCEAINAYSLQGLALPLTQRLSSGIIVLLQHFLGLSIPAFEGQVADGRCFEGEEE